MRRGVIVRPAQGVKALEDGARGGAAQLLMNDGVGELLEGRLAAGAELEGAEVVDQPGHHRVFLQMFKGAFAHGGE